METDHIPVEDTTITAAVKRMTNERNASVIILSNDPEKRIRDARRIRSIEVFGTVITGEKRKPTIKYMGCNNI